MQNNVQPQTEINVPSYAQPIPKNLHINTKNAQDKTFNNIGNKPVALSDLIRILIGVFLSGGPESEYDDDPNGPQLTKATYTICDVVNDSLGISVPREIVLRGAYLRYKLNLPISIDGQIVTGDGPNRSIK